MNKKYPFPFLGAGKPSYTEWCEVHIKFRTIPSVEEKKKILRSAPKLFLSAFTTSFKDTLRVRTYEDVYEDLEEIYGNSTNAKASKGADNDPEYLLSLFEKELEQWLLQTHIICPIEVACRYEYDTKFSEWHKESIKVAGDLLTHWSAQDHGKEWERLEIFITWILEYAEKQIPKNIVEEALKHFIPNLWTSRLLKAQRFDEVMAVINKSSADSNYIYQIANGIDGALYEGFKKEGSLMPFCRSLIPLLDTKRSADYFTRFLPVATKLAVRADDDVLLKIIQTYLSKARGIEGITYDLAGIVYEESVLKKKWHQAIDFFEFLMDLTKSRKDFQYVNYTLYCNALVVLNKDYTGLEVNVKKNKKFLKLCLPYGKFNPPIYFNAGTLYVEMNDFTKALECFKKYFAVKKDSARKRLMKGLKTDPMYNSFRADKATSKFLKTLK